MSQRTRFTVLYYVWLFSLILLIDSLFFSSPTIPELPYSTFLELIDEDRLASAVITQDTIYGELEPGLTAAALKAAGADTGRAPIPARATGATPETSPRPTSSPALLPASEAERTAAAEDTAKAPADTEDVLPIPAKETPWRFDPRSWLARWQGFRERAEQEQRARADLLSREFTVLPLPDPGLVERLQGHGVKFRSRVESRWLSDLFWNWVVPFGIMFLIWGAVMRRMGQGPSALNLGRSKAKVYEAVEDTKVHFADVAGVDEAIEETREVVQFLKEPDKFTRLGAKLPKGVLLVGPPGTGKTLLARAVAGESGVPFFSLSGSDFVEMFVGVGAARVRDLFAEAKKKAPCIVFIDELDAIGKSRGGAGPVAGGGFDERENTLNQLLVEMDGFDGRAGVVIMAATNRPEVLDAALRRPGRFDREILVDRPDRSGRLAILRVHAKGLPLGPDVDLERLAGETTGFVGADLANLCNEAALIASRSTAQTIAMADFQNAIERIIGGLEKKGRVLNAKERRTVAYHESGHAIVGWFTPGADPVQKISIVPRGRGALGYTLQAPLEDRFLMSKDEILGRVRTLLGGRAAEEVVFGCWSTGAVDDLAKANKIVREMLTIYGMSEQLPNLSLLPDTNEGFLGGGRPESPHSAEIEHKIDSEAQAIRDRCFAEAKDTLIARRDLLDALATRLLAQEKVDDADLREILGPRPPAPGGCDDERDRLLAARGTQESGGR